MLSEQFCGVESSQSTWSEVKMLPLSRLSRFYSSAAKSQLAILRKTTGFPISKCKQALTENNADLEEAKKWLYSQAQAEGWAKVEKLKDRSANQGLIGLMIRGNMGAMVEVNYCGGVGCWHPTHKRGHTLPHLASIGPCPPMGDFCTSRCWIFVPLVD